MLLNHPPKDHLIAFGQGKLAADESLYVEQHLNACTACCETLFDLKDDTFAGLVRDAGRLKLQEDIQPAVSTPETEGVSADRASQSPTLIAPSVDGAAPDELPIALAEHPRYRIVELIGRGGMGSVYRAEHRLMNRSVAIKLVNAQLMKHPLAVERFHREVQAAAKLSHPNIVAAYDAEQAGGAHFLVMEFVNGTDLAAIVQQHGPMDVAEACRCIRQAADGLQHAHERGMVHRDIKPHNLMLSAGNQVRILDFGLAGFAAETAWKGGVDRDVDDPALDARMSAGAMPAGESLIETSAAHLTAIGSVMGTPDYMAPEQAANAHSADIRADIYSLGCTLHFLLTGKPPFEEEDVLMKLKAHAHKLPPSPTALRKDVPTELSHIVARMMAKNPAERFQTPAEVAAALAPFSQFAQKAPRRRTLRTMLASAAILLAGVIFIGTDKGRIEIHSDRDDVELVILKGGAEFKAIDLQTGTQVTWLPSGEYQVVLRRGNDYVNLDQQGFKLSRWGKEIVTVRREPLVAVPDEQRLQGKWIAVSGHARNRKLTAAELAQYSITFDGDRVEIAPHTSRPTPQAGKFTINPNRDPKQIDFVAPDKKESLPGIYEFDGSRLKLAVIDQDYSRPTNFAPDHRPDHLTVVLERVSTTAPLGDEERQILKATEAFLALFDRGKYDQLHDLASTLARSSTTRDQMTRSFETLSNTLGKAHRRTLQRLQLVEEWPGLPAGRYAAAQYKTQFTNRRGELWEGVLSNLDPDGQWRVNTYAATIEPLPIPEPKKKPNPGAENQEPRRSPLGPPPAIPLGKNLIADPSLEATSPGQPYPADWGKGNVMPPEAYKHQVVDGGRTGKRGWLIEGDGQFAVIPTNRPPAHPAYRYAASAWVRIESGSAQIKLLYFDAGGQYIGENRGNVTIDRDGWHRLTMIDDLKTYKEARSLSLALTLTGKGKVVFDDLELIAFDADKLPEKFEAKHGAPRHSTAVFDRWVGRWESTTVYKPTAATPNARTIEGEVVVRKILDDRFLLWQWANEAGDMQYLSMLGFDDNLGAYRIWVFSSTGEVFERAGQWDGPSQTLALDVKPPSPGVKGKSTDRFVNDNRIESTLRVTNASGQVSRDMQATWIRKSSTVPADLALSNGPVAGSEELVQLNMLAGDWTIRQTMKPSIWFPTGEAKTFTERTRWAVGGRFLVIRTFDENQRMETFAVTSYEPAEKSYHYWHFARDVFGGQWRITWDPASRGFHWRAIDMPAGWIGSGFNRWINDDAFDKHALIKDETGRVLLDSQQDKQRKK